MRPSSTTSCSGRREERSDLDRVLVVAAQREMISRYTSAVRAGGLRPAGVDVKALSLTRSALPEPFFDEGAVLLLDVGAEITNLAIAERGNPILTRFVPSGLGDFVAAVVGGRRPPRGPGRERGARTRGSGSVPTRR